MIELSEHNFQTIAEIVKSVSGIVLGSHKRDLVHGRLMKRLKEHDFTSFSDYCQLLSGPAGDEERRHMVNAITTNLTHFFREPHHFDHLKQVLAKRLGDPPGRDGKTLRIWSAGCSSGEEPYSIAMTVREALKGHAGWNVKILATDIDTEMVRRTRLARYDAASVAKVPADHRAKSFTRIDESSFVVEPGVKSLVVCNQLNLFDEWPMRKKFDFIFCRNVVIYFSQTDKKKIFERFHSVLKEDGLLFVGHSESLLNICDSFRPVAKTVYRRIA